jgi:hypothetical protein
MKGIMSHALGAQRSDIPVLYEENVEVTFEDGQSITTSKVQDLLVRRAD